MLLSWLLVLAVAAWADEPVAVVSFSSVLTELATEVGGRHVRVTNLIPPDTDPHEYQPTPRDLRAVSEARLVLTPGQQLEAVIRRLPAATGSGARLVDVGEGLVADDPHWWHSVALVKKATGTVRDALIQIAPAAEADFQKNADAYIERLDALESWVKRKVAELPRDRRKLVTSHDAFRALAQEYGFTVFAIEGTSTEAEASNRHVAELIDEIRRAGVKAIFLESTLNPKVTREITRETGAKIGGTLYADGLGEGDAATYPGMVKHNITTIVEALK